MSRHLIELAQNAKCRACGRPATFVRHEEPGVYRPETDHHFCDQHAEGMTEDEVLTWTKGWELGYSAGQHRVWREISDLLDHHGPLGTASSVVLLRIRNLASEGCVIPSAATESEASDV